MIELKTFEVVKETHITIPFLGNSYNGVLRGSFEDCINIMPELREVFDSCPIEEHKLDQYEFDVKIHMLKKGQYPCIPYLHCDFVPRVEGNVRYDLIEETEDEMFLWLSGTPCTSFLSKNVDVEYLENHGSLNGLLEDHDMVKIPPQTWIKMDRLTPHKGNVCEKDIWRVFVRAAKKIITPDRPIDLNPIRRHSQVYIDNLNFNW